MVPGAQAFLLYDSFGFPLELTAEIAAERGATVAVAGFEEAMEEQRRRSKDAVKVLDAPRSHIVLTRSLLHRSVEFQACLALLQHISSERTVGVVQQRSNDRQVPKQNGCWRVAP